MVWEGPVYLAKAGTSNSGHTRLGWLANVSSNLKMCKISKLELTHLK